MTVAFPALNSLRASTAQAAMAAALCLLPVAAQAQWFDPLAEPSQRKEKYLDLAVQSVSLNDRVFDDNFYMARIGYGVRLSKYLGLEMQAATGVQEVDSSVNGQSVAANIDGLYSVFLKAGFEVLKNLEVFGRVGYSFVDLETKNNVTGAKRAFTEGDFSYGAGVAYAIRDDIEVVADYTRFVDVELQGGNLQAEGVSAGLRLSF